MGGVIQGRADGKVASDGGERYPIVGVSKAPQLKTRLVGTPNDPARGCGIYR